MILGYRGLYLKRTGDQKDGCAIFYDTHYLELVDENYVKYQKYKGMNDAFFTSIPFLLLILFSSRLPES